MGDFNTYWRMTINNYDERDLALVRQGYPDDIRKLIWTLEEGENGTPHIQAYIQMKRSVRLSHMKKLFPGANFGTSTSAEWRLNQHNYPQKNDETTRSAHVIQNNDPLHTIEGTMRRVVDSMMDKYKDDPLHIGIVRLRVEREMVLEDYTLAKTFVSATYKAMWQKFEKEIYACLRKKWEEARVLEKELTHTTHTHTEEIISREGGITDASEDEDSVSGSDWETNEESESDEDGEAEEAFGSSESGSTCSGSSDDF